MRTILTITLLCTLAACSRQNPLKAQVDRLQQEVDALKSAEATRSELLERLASIEVTPENVSEIAELQRLLQKPTIESPEVAALRVRIEALERKQPDWAVVVSKIERSVYAIGVYIGSQSLSTSGIIFIGTGFAVGDSLIVTNAHVVNALREASDYLQQFNSTQGGDLVFAAVAVRNTATSLQLGSNTLLVGSTKIHPDWRSDNLLSPDVGLLIVNRRAQLKTFKSEPRTEKVAVSAGTLKPGNFWYWDFAVDYAKGRDFTMSGLVTATGGVSPALRVVIVTTAVFDAWKSGGFMSNAVLTSLYDYRNSDSANLSVAVRNSGQYKLVIWNTSTLFDIVIQADVSLQSETTTQQLQTISQSRLYDKATILETIGAPGSVRAGQPIGTLGFPGELQGNIILLPVIATFKDGTISALRTSGVSSINYRDTFVVQHNLDLTGGTSGSPLFDGSGRVIGINNSGTEYLVFDQNSREYKRVAVGALGFGIRADKIQELLQQPRAKPLASNVRVAAEDLGH